MSESLGFKLQLSQLKTLSGMANGKKSKPQLKQSAAKPLRTIQQRKLRYNLLI